MKNQNRVASEKGVNPRNMNMHQANQEDIEREACGGSLEFERKNGEIKSTKPDKCTPKIAEKKDDYVLVEYESPILGIHVFLVNQIVDDEEFWFPPGKKSMVEYRSASGIGNFDFDANGKRIKALRMELEKKGWASEASF
ncbi:hypothetical protein Gotur_029877 [Gossypium turneri]